MTAKSSDQQIVESNSAFKFTGVVFYIYANTKADFVNTSAIHRFYLPQNKDHFYTADEDEYSSIKNNHALDSTFIDEGIEGSVLKYEKGATCPAGTKPVYRLYKNDSQVDKKRHRYSADPTLIASMVSQGWINENVSFCSFVQ
jgi:hypothetical protein